MSTNDITPDQRIAIDKLLVKIAKVECNEGKDSTPKELNAARTKKQGYLLKIREVTQTFYDEIEPDRRETEEDKKYKKI